MRYIFFLHFVTDWFALGRSSVKIFLVTLSLVVLFVANIFARKQKTFFWDKWFEKISFKNIFFGVSGAIFIFGMAVTFYYYRLLNISFRYLPMAIGERNISMTHFFHTHVLKFSFGLVSTILPEGLRLFLENKTDFGFAFFGILPPWVGVVGFVACIAVGVLGIFLIFDFAREHKKSISLQILFAIVLISSLKNMFDGGLLNSETIPALTILWVLCFGYSLKKSWKTITPIALQFVPIIAVIVAYPLGAINLIDIPQYIERFYGLELIFFGWVFFTEKGALKKYIAAALIVIGLYFIAPAFLLSATDISYAETQISGQQVYFVTFSDTAPGTLVEKINDLSFYKFEATSSMTIADLAAEVGDNTSYGPVKIDTADCAAPNIYSAQDFPVLSKEKLTRVYFAHKLANIASLNLLGEENGWYRYIAKIVTNPCAPDLLGVTGALLEEAGGKNIVILDSIKGSSITY